MQVMVWRLSSSSASRRGLRPEIRTYLWLWSAAFTVGLFFAGLDGLLRDGRRFEWASHVLAVLWLDAALAGLIAIAGFVLLLLERNQLEAGSGLLPEDWSVSR